MDLVITGVIVARRKSTFQIIITFSHNRYFWKLNAQLRRTPSTTIVIVQQDNKHLQIPFNTFKQNTRYMYHNTEWWMSWASQTYFPRASGSMPLRWLVTNLQQDTDIRHRLVTVEFLRVIYVLTIPRIRWKSITKGNIIKWASQRRI